MNAIFTRMCRRALHAVVAVGLLTVCRAGSAQINPPFTLLYTFDATTNNPPYTNADGGYPYAGLTLSNNGSVFYGTTAFGGVNGNGTIYKITPTGQLTLLYTFPSTTNPNFIELAGVVQAANSSALYGMNPTGGANGTGTILQISPSGVARVLHTFSALSTSGANSDGAYPGATLLQASDGSFYGTTTGGGVYGNGTIFKITPHGAFTALHSFSVTDGVNSQPLIQAIDGNLYGVTYNGGANVTSTFPGDGTIFQLAPDPATGLFDSGSAFTVLHDFSGPDGASSSAPLIQGSDGNLYGVTYEGGATLTSALPGYGTIFQLAPDPATGAFDANSVLTTLYNFTGGSDGAYPADFNGLQQGPDGNLYGAATDWFYSPAYLANGSVFRLAPDPATGLFDSGSVLTTIFTFPTISLPWSNPVLGADNNFYGINLNGGVNGSGVFYKLTMTPIVSSLTPSIGKIGTWVTLTGVNFTEATYVTLGSSECDFKVNSDTSLSIRIPYGARTNYLHVYNPFGAGRSATRFTVTH